MQSFFSRVSSKIYTVENTALNYRQHKTDHHLVKYKHAEFKWHLGLFNADFQYATESQETNKLQDKRATLWWRVKWTWLCHYHIIIRTRSFINTHNMTHNSTHFICALKSNDRFFVSLANGSICWQCDSMGNIEDYFRSGL